MKKQIKKPSFSSYAVLCGPFLILCFLVLHTSLTRPETGGLGIAIACFIISLLFAAWVNGHEISIKDESITYRNGWYVEEIISLEKISYTKEIWMKHNYLVRVVSTPALGFFDSKNRKLLSVNSKLFPRGTKKWIDSAVSDKKDNRKKIT